MLTWCIAKRMAGKHTVCTVLQRSQCCANLLTVYLPSFPLLLFFFSFLGSLLFFRKEVRLEFEILLGVLSYQKNKIAPLHKFLITLCYIWGWTLPFSQIGLSFSVFNFYLRNILKKIYFQDDTASDKDKEYKFEILFGF